MLHWLYDLMIASARNACRGVFVFAFLCAFQVGCRRAPEVTSPEPDEPEPTQVAAKVADPVAAPLRDEFEGVPADDIFEATDLAANYVASSVEKGPSPQIGFEPFVVETLQNAATGETFSIAGDAASNGEGRSGPIKLPTGFVILQGPKIAGGLPARIRGELDGSEMLLVTGGETFVGTNLGPPETQPQVSLVLDAFYVGVTEVRVSQYLEVRRKFGSKGSGMAEPMNATSPADHPAIGVTWGDAKNYAQAVGCDLPTEAQWEKAARGSNGFSHPWGESRPLWTAPRSISQIEAVGSHAEDCSPFGVMDLAGNAREWTQDFFQEKAFSTLEQLAVERRRNWSGPRSSATTALRVVKGNGPDWKVWARQGVKMTDRESRIGFRCVLNLSAEK